MGINKRQALDCFASDDLIGIGMEADSVRRGLHPDGIVTYTVDRAFGFTLNSADLLKAVEPAVAEGVTTIRIVTPSDGSMELANLEKSLTALRYRFPALRIQALTATEITALACSSGLREDEVLNRLHSAGLAAIEGSTSGSHRRAGWSCMPRRIAPPSLPGIDDLRRRRGVEEFVEHLAALHSLQEESAGFTSVSLHGFRTEGGRAEFEQPTAVEYLRTLAIARMFLDNVENVESSSADEGLKVMQMALRFGANDGGAIAGPEGSFPASFTESDLRRVIRDAGFAPVERDTLYRTMFLNN